MNFIVCLEFCIEVAEVATPTRADVTVVPVSALKLFV